jgi:hypothetical protein
VQVIHAAKLLSEKGNGPMVAADMFTCEKKTLENGNLWKPILAGNAVIVNKKGEQKVGWPMINQEIADWSIRGSRCSEKVDPVVGKHHHRKKAFTHSCSSVILKSDKLT